MSALVVEYDDQDKLTRREEKRCYLSCGALFYIDKLRRREGEGDRCASQDEERQA